MAKVKPLLELLGYEDTRGVLWPQGQHSLKSLQAKKLGKLKPCYRRLRVKYKT